MKLTITTTGNGPPDKTTTIAADNELNGAIVSLTAAFSRLADAALRFSLVVERETKQ